MRIGTKGPVLNRHGLPIGQNHNTPGKWVLLFRHHSFILNVAYFHFARLRVKSGVHITGCARKDVPMLQVFYLTYTIEVV